MNKFKKRIIDDWKQMGFLTMSYIEYYNRMKTISDLTTACKFYIRYINVYSLLKEHNR